MKPKIKKPYVFQIIQEKDITQSFLRKVIANLMIKNSLNYSINRGGKKTTPTQFIIKNSLNKIRIILLSIEMKCLKKIFFL